MKNALLITCTLLVAASAVSPVSAQSYRWKDAKGQTIISDTPPPRSAKAESSGVSQKQDSAPNSSLPATSKEANAVNSKTTSAPKTIAEKDMEFKKRQKDEQERIDKASLEQKNAASNKQACETARQAISALQSSGQINHLNSKGETVPMDGNARKNELERARKVAEETCK